MIDQCSLFYIAFTFGIMYLSSAILLNALLLALQDIVHSIFLHHYDQTLLNYTFQL